MITFFILIILLVSQLSINMYNYFSIDSANGYGKYDAGISRNLTLSAAVLSSSFLFFILSIYILKLINYNRGEILLTVSILFISILMLLSYHYLEKQKKSHFGYPPAVDNLKNNIEDLNIKELNLALYGGSVTLGIVMIIIGMLLGKYFLTEKKIVNLEKPVYLNMQTTENKEDSYMEPDYMSNISKNFII